MSVIQKMKTVAEALKLQNVEGGPVYLKLYNEDFEKYDVDSIQNFYKAGDNLIWEVRGDGCGTRLYHTQSGIGLHDFKNAALPTSKFFALELTGQDEGVVKELNHAEALAYYESKYEPGMKEPYRPSIQDLIKDSLGIDSKNPLPRDFASDLMPTTDEPIYLQFSTDFQRRSIQCLMAKPDLKEDDPGISRTKVSTGRYYLPPDIKALDKLAQPLHLKIVPGMDSVYGKAEIVSQQMFHAAVRKITDRENKKGLEI